jgi:hypothetical protein
VDRAKEVGRLLQIGDGEPEEQVLARNPALGHRLDIQVVSGALGDGVVEDGRIRREAGDRQRIDVSLERPRGEQIPGDIVEP